MLVEILLPAAREHLATVGDDASVIQAAKLLGGAYQPRCRMQFWWCDGRCYQQKGRGSTGRPLSGIRLHHGRFQRDDSRCRCL